MKSGPSSISSQLAALQRSIGNKNLVRLLENRSESAEVAPETNYVPESTARGGRDGRVSLRSGSGLASSVDVSVQRNVRVTGSADVLYGRDIERIRRFPASRKLQQLFAMCEGSSRTDLVIDTFTGSMRDAQARTNIEVIGTDNRAYDLDRPRRVDWDKVQADSPIVIKLKMNSALVYGRASDIETILHELVVHAAEYVPHIRLMRSSRKNAIPSIWLNSAWGSNNGDRQHQRLGEGFNRALSAEMDASSRHLAGEGMASHLHDSLQDDVHLHYPDARYHSG